MPITSSKEAADRATRPYSAATLAKNPNVNPLALGDALDAETSHDWRDWEPEMLRDFLGLGEDDVQQLDKVMAVQVAVTNPDVFEDWHLFLAVCSAFNHRRSSFDWVDQPSYLEAAWACVCLRFLEGQHQFGPGVIRFLGAVCILDGLVYFPWIGGEGLHLCEGATGEWAKGLVDPELCKLGAEVRRLWEAGSLHDLVLEEEPGAATDPLRAQLEKIVAAQMYFRSQRPRFPDAYEELL